MQDLTQPRDAAVQVTQKEFYKVIYENKLDVHPRVVVPTLKNRHHVSVWRMKGGSLFGWTKTDSHGLGDNSYFIARDAPGGDQ